MTTDSEVMAVPAGEWQPPVCPGCGHPFCPEYSDSDTLCPLPILYCSKRCRKRCQRQRYKVNAAARKALDVTQPVVREDVFIPGCSDKVFYLDLKYAKQALERLQLQYPNTKGIPRRAYHCKQCGGAHLTSKPQGTD